MGMKPLYQYLGDPVVMYISTLSSAGVAASDNIQGVTNGAYGGILFLQIDSGGDSDFAGSIQFQYSSTGSASDAVTSNATFTATDMVGSSNNDTTSSGNIKMIDLDIENKPGVGDAAGAWFVSMAAAETGGKYFAFIGIPYGGTRLLPATNAEPAVDAKA